MGEDLNIKTTKTQLFNFKSLQRSSCSLGYFRTVPIFHSLSRWSTLDSFYFCSSSALPKVSFVLQVNDHRGVGYHIIYFSVLVWLQAGLESAEARQSLRLSLILQLKSRWEAALWAFTRRMALQAAKCMQTHR